MATASLFGRAPSNKKKKRNVARCETNPRQQTWPTDKHVQPTFQKPMLAVSRPANLNGMAVLVMCAGSLNASNQSNNFGGIRKLSTSTLQSPDSAKERLQKQRVQRQPNLGSEVGLGWCLPASPAPATAPRYMRALSANAPDARLFCVRAILATLVWLGAARPSPSSLSESRHGRRDGSTGSAAPRRNRPASKRNRTACSRRGCAAASRRKAHRRNWPRPSALYPHAAIAPAPRQPQESPRTLR